MSANDSGCLWANLIRERLPTTKYSFFFIQVAYWLVAWGLKFNRGDIVFLNHQSGANILFWESIVDWVVRSVVDEEVLFLLVR